MLIPKFSHRSIKRPEAVLIICYYDPLGISTVPETVAFMQEFSRFSVTVLNLYEHGKHGFGLCLNPSLNLRKFSGIIVHNSISYNVDNLKSLDSRLKFGLKDFEGVKVLMRQDENYKFKEMAEYIGRIGFDLILTCLPDEAIPIIYPQHLVGKPVFSRMLTGYVTPTLRMFSTNKRCRRIDVGYRGSIQALSFGRLAYEKRKIGYDFANHPQAKKLALDISSRWEDRLGGDAWFEFLASCKATLGVESGASIFDLNGDLSQRCALAEEKYGPVQDDPQYAENYLSELVDLEGNVYYNQISPRHFEAAATRTLQIMYPGSYSGIFIKNRHYVELARDCSNIDEVIEVIQDENSRDRIVECAYDEIISNKKYWIETFASQLDHHIARLLMKKGAYAQPLSVSGRAKKNVLLLSAKNQSAISRISLIADYVPDELSIVQVGVSQSDEDRAVVNRGASEHLTLEEPCVSFNQQMLRIWQESVSGSASGWAGLAEIRSFASALELNGNDFLELFGAPDVEKVVDFKLYLRRILDVTATLVAKASNYYGYRAIIASNIETLPAALILSGMNGIPVIYDVNEFRSEINVTSLEFEKAFWLALEARLVRFVAFGQTISPWHAKLLSDQYEKEFISVPNFDPLQILGDLIVTDGNDRSCCVFFYQGDFDENCGVDILIKMWDRIDSRATLILCGSDSTYKRDLLVLAQATGLLGGRIQFIDFDAANEYFNANQVGVVGLVPYVSKDIPSSQCFFSSVSRYMASNLPILSNKIEYLSEIIRDEGLGLVVDFSNFNEFSDAIEWFVSNSDARREMGKKAFCCFQNKLKWEISSQPMYKKINEILVGASAGPLRVFASSQYLDLYRPLTLRQKVGGKAFYYIFRAVRHLSSIVPVGVKSAYGARFKRILNATIK